MSRNDTKNNIDVINFGCRLNALEGDQILDAARNAGLTQATIINSCAVTEEAMRQARKSARKAKRDNPDHKIIVTGCAAQTDAAQFASMAEVDHVIGNMEKTEASSYAPQAPKLAVSDIMAETNAKIAKPGITQKRARAFVQIQNGCDHRCTFCIIPFGRGNSRSLPIHDVIAQCRDLLAQGHREIVLTGVDITSWGPDINEADLGKLVKDLLDHLPDLERLRLSSVDAIELDPNFLDIVINEPRLMPHLHLSLQAGDDMILKRMKRRHSRAEAVALCNHIKSARPDMTFGADLIAGFPTETDAMFENSVALIEDCQLTWLHVFPFSPRPNTPAARMPQLSKDLITERAKHLREAGDSYRQQWLHNQVGQDVLVLMENDQRGRAENFAQVIFKTAITPHTITRARITGVQNEFLLGEQY